jgi:hypothetical protein
LQLIFTVLVVEKILRQTDSYFTEPAIFFVQKMV